MPKRTIFLCMFTAVSVLLVLSARHTDAQYLGMNCPGQWVTNAAGGQSCQCPDGSFANGQMVGGSWQPYCPASGQIYETQQPETINCGGWSCPVGSQCSRVNYGNCLPNGVNECANGTMCPAGYQCTSRGTDCIAAGAVECGNHSCYPGYYCGSGDSCIQEGSIDCGNGNSCPAGNKCTSDGAHCIASDTVDCGDYFCVPGLKCGTGKKCLVADAVDCGNGNSCEAGHICRPGGGCATHEQLAAEKAAAEERKKFEAAQKEEERKQKIAQEEENRKAKTALEQGVSGTKGSNGAQLNSDLKDIRTLQPPTGSSSQQAVSPQPIPKSCPSTLSYPGQLLDKNGCPAVTVGAPLQTKAPPSTKTNDARNNPYLSPGPTPQNKVSAQKRVIGSYLKGAAKENEECPKGPFITGNICAVNAMPGLLCDVCKTGTYCDLYEDSSVGNCKTKRDCHAVCRPNRL